jgi:hypothetical protein
MRVPEVGRKQRQVTLDIDTASIPVEERASGQPVTKIVQTRPSGVVVIA